MAQPLVEYDFKHNGERLLHMLRQHHPEYHPIVSIANIAHMAEQLPEPELDTALRAHAIILKYIEPELKSVEVNINADRKRTISVSLFEEEPPELLANQMVTRQSEFMNKVLEIDVLDAVEVGNEQG